MSALADPIVKVSPNCGPSSVQGFNVEVNANGFKPHHLVKWKLVDSQDRIPLYGYFQTNSTGGFNDGTLFDDLIPDTYAMYFGNDNLKATSILESITGPQVEISIPCPAGQNPSNTTATSTESNNSPANVTLLSQRLKIGSSGYNDVIGQVKNVGNDTAESIKIGLTTFDKNGEILGTDFGYANAQTLLPNQKSSFDISSQKDNFIGMRNYELSIQWSNSDGTEGYIDNAQPQNQNIMNSSNR